MSTDYKLHVDNSHAVSFSFIGIQLLQVVNILYSRFQSDLSSDIMVAMFQVPVKYQDCLVL